MYIRFLFKYTGCPFGGSSVKFQGLGLRIKGPAGTLHAGNEGTAGILHEEQDAAPGPKWESSDTTSLGNSL